jgi:hypothetical protein
MKGRTKKRKIAKRKEKEARGSIRTSKEGERRKNI